jgi:hypothetical protein
VSEGGLELSLGLLSAVPVRDGGTAGVAIPRRDDLVVGLDRDAEPAIAGAEIGRQPAVAVERLIEAAVRLVPSEREVAVR